MIMDSATGFLNGLYYEIAGEGQPLVLIHSALMNSKMWDTQVEAFAPLGERRLLDRDPGRGPGLDDLQGGDVRREALGHGVERRRADDRVVRAYEA